MLYEVIDLTKRCLQQYQEKAKKLERMARFVERIGIENLKEALLLIFNSGNDTVQLTIHLF